MTTRHVVSRARVDRRETETRDATNSAVRMSMREGSVDAAAARASRGTKTLGRATRRERGVCYAR
jgi:hypothetical protein